MYIAQINTWFYDKEHFEAHFQMLHCIIILSLFTFKKLKILDTNTSARAEVCSRTNSPTNQVNRISVLLKHSLLFYLVFCTSNNIIKQEKVTKFTVSIRQLHYKRVLHKTTLGSISRLSKKKQNVSDED
jgi:hypothetical protein